MSAIAAAYGPFDEAQGLRMLERMEHRGPDGVGTLGVGGGWIGTVRLAITDTDPELAPLTESGRGAWLAGDGEIYNYRRIRESLGPDRFSSETDLEAALLLYEDLGVRAFSRLWGSYALVVATADGGFAVARDVLGIAPLYWARRGDTTLFASEMKAFDDDWRSAVRPFPPGHVWTPDGGLIEGPEAPGSGPVLLQSRAPDEDPPAWVFDAIRETVIRAVERQLQAQVPVGLLLSGGVDSSIIAAIAARVAAKHGERLPSFAVGIAGSRDLEAARAVAEHVGTDHSELVYTAEDAISLVPRIIAELESFDPTLVHSAVPHHMVAALAAEHVKVVLAGEGADELFAGYEHFSALGTGTELHEELVGTLAGMHAGGLQRVDRMAAAHGVEPRMPFLDLDVVELAMALPAEWKMPSADRTAKWLLRRAFDGWLPDDVLWRRKEQFGQGTGMNTVLREHFEAEVTQDDLLRESGRLDPPIRTREELAYFRIFTDALPGIEAERTVVRFAEA